MPKDNGVKVETEAPFTVFPDLLRYEKRSSAGPAQYNGLRSGPKAYPGYEAWGRGSYDRAGRAHNRDAPGYDKSKCDYKVGHTTDRLK